MTISMKGYKHKVDRLIPQMKRTTKSFIQLGLMKKATSNDKWSFLGDFVLFFFTIVNIVFFPRLHL